MLHDINRFPKTEGMLVFGISMSRISNSQSAKYYIDYIKEFFAKIQYPKVGATFLYSDGLYLHSDEKAHVLKTKYQNLVNSHINEFKKLQSKHPIMIPDAVSYYTWSQTLTLAKNFYNYLGKLKKFYDQDTQMKALVSEDIICAGFEENENSINYILEEILVLYLISKGQIKFKNDYVKGEEKWTLNCYPGKPLESERYLFQKNIFNLTNPNNAYENSFYDLESNVLHRYC